MHKLYLHIPSAFRSKVSFYPSISRLIFIALRISTDHMPYFVSFHEGL